DLAVFDLNIDRLDRGKIAEMFGQLVRPDGDGVCRPFTKLALAREFRGVQGTAQTAKDRYKRVLKSRLAGSDVMHLNACFRQSSRHPGLARRSILDHEIQAIPKSLDVFNLGSPDQQIFGAAEVV